MKNFKQISNNKKTAFSLIELSIVILIIGIIIAGVTQSSRLVKQFKLSTARTLTQSSPAPSIKNLEMWLETTSIASFDDSATEDSQVLIDNGTSESDITGVATWYDINPTSGIKHNATQGTGANKPRYFANRMNSLPCLKFNGSAYKMAFDGSFLAGTDYTIFVVEQRRTSVAYYFLGSSSATSQNTVLRMGYTASATLALSQGSSAGYTGVVTGYSTASPHLHTLVNNYIASGGSTALTYYSNGSGTATSLTGSGAATLSSFANASIGYDATGTNYYTGDIGEIIVYTRALKTEERTAVESYLLKKWGIAKAS